MAYIAVIDDDPSIRNMLRLALKRDGHECTTYSSAAAAREGVSKKRPDLILLDVSLSDDNGIDVCRRLKTDAALGAVPVILMTGEAGSIEHRLAGLSAGADDYVLKPFDVVELKLRLKVVLGQR